MRKLLSIFPFILQEAEALMKFLVSERDTFANHIYLYLVKISLMPQLPEV